MEIILSNWTLKSSWLFYDGNKLIICCLHDQHCIKFAKSEIKKPALWLRNLMCIYMGGNCVFRIELTLLTCPVSSLQVKIIASCLGFWLVGRCDLSNIKKPSSGRLICIPLKTSFGTHICSPSIYLKGCTPTGRISTTIMKSLNR